MTRRDTLLRQAFVLHADNLGSRVVKGASYQFLGIVLRTGITIGSTAILARLLRPADFGYIAMATVVTEFAALFANFGFSALLIQRRVINRLKVDTIFWASAALGVVLALGVFVASFFAGFLFADPSVGVLLRALCSIFVLAGLTSVPGIVISRLMRFRAELWINIIAAVTRTLVAIGFAYAGFGVWSLVAGSVAGALAQVVLGFIMVPYWPRWRFHGAYLKGTWRTSSSYFGGGLLFYANTNFDLILIGRQLGATSLGFYQNARSLTEEIRARIAIPLQHVLFPAFSTLQADDERMRSVVLRSARLLAALTFPIGVGVSAMADELVPLLYGPNWLPMIPVMSMFGLSSAFKASTAIATPLFNSQNRVGLSFRYNLIGTLLLLAAVLLSLPYGIESVARWVAVMSLYGLLPFLAALRLVGLGLHSAVKILGPPALGGLVSWCTVLFLRQLALIWLNTPAAMIFLLGGGWLISYLSTLWIVSREHFVDFGQVVLNLRRR